MKYKVIAVVSLLLSVISLVCAVTAERRARVAAERASASQRAALEREITERVLAQIMPRIVRTNSPVVRRVPANRQQPELGLWHPTMPPKRVD